MKYNKNKMIHKKQNNKTYTPEDIVIFNMRKHKGIIAYNKMSWFRWGVGMVSLYGGLITLPLPTGSIFMIGLGCYLLGYDSKIIVKNSVYKIKCLSNWVYANRTPKRILYTIKTRLLSL